MEHSRRLNKKINTLHERCLPIICNDKQSTFQKLLDKDKSVSIHNRNAQTLATEMFKVSKDLAPDIFLTAFSTRNKLNYNLCHASHFDVPLVYAVYNGTKSISFLGSKFGICYAMR